MSGTAARADRSGGEVNSPRSRAAATTRVLALSLGAFAVYGGWAAWVNAVHGTDAQWRAGVAQGMASFVATASITGIIEALRVRLRDRTRGDVFAVVIAACVASAWHVTVNLIAGTHSLIATIAPSVTMTWAFGALYALGLRKLSRLDARASRSTPPIGP